MKVPSFSSLISKIDDLGSACLMQSFGALAFLGNGASEHLSFATVASCYEADHRLQCPSYIWSPNGNLSSHVHAS